MRSLLALRVAKPDIVLVCTSTFCSSIFSSLVGANSCQTKLGY
jgi:hypothetical protein